MYRKRPPSSLAGTVKAAMLLLTDGLTENELSLMLGAGVTDPRTRYVPGVPTSGTPPLIAAVALACPTLQNVRSNAWKAFDAEDFVHAVWNVWEALTRGGDRSNPFATNRTQLRRCARATVLAAELLRTREAAMGSTL